MEMLVNFIKFCNYRNFLRQGRNFSRSNTYRNIEKSKPNEPAPEPSTPTFSPGTIDFIPSEWDKKILVWSGRFKLEDIPSRISFATMDNAKSRLRIRIANVMIIGVFFLCGYYVWLGKKYQREKRISLQNEN